jgi:hypothetical protein
LQYRPIPRYEQIGIKARWGGEKGSDEMSSASSVAGKLAFAGPVARQTDACRLSIRRSCTSLCGVADAGEIGVWRRLERIARGGVVELARLKYSAPGRVNTVGWHQGIP